MVEEAEDEHLHREVELSDDWLLRQRCDVQHEDVEEELLQDKDRGLEHRLVGDEEGNDDEDEASCHEHWVKEALLHAGWAS